MDNDTRLDPAVIDKAYKPFPEFKLWATLKVDNALWDQMLGDLNRAGAKDPERLGKAREVAKRAAAIDTGALEGLYTVESGFTITVAMQVGFWRATYEREKEETRKIIESQLAGYDQVIDFATRQTPLLEVWLRGLHKVLCAEQKTYRVQTEQGIQEHELPLGEYKKLPNHVVLPNGSTHAYAPVHETEAEVRRLLHELNSPVFQSAHPLVQAAFAHYALVWIHPFADGNGRAARALASVFTYRAASIPYSVLMDQKNEYLQSLRSADDGNYQGFVDFAFRRAMGTFRLVKTSLIAAQHPPTDHVAEQAKRLHLTRGGYTHQEVDTGGAQLIRVLHDKAKEYSKQYNVPYVSYTTEFRNEQFRDSESTAHRPPRSRQQEVLHVRLDSAQPAQAQVSRNFCYYVPIDAGPGDHYIVHCIQTKEQAVIPVEDSTQKSPTTEALLILYMYFDGIFAAALDLLTRQGTEYLKKSGY